MWSVNKLKRNSVCVCVCYASLLLSLFSFCLIFLFSFFHDLSSPLTSLLPPKLLSFFFINYKSFFLWICPRFCPYSFILLSAHSFFHLSLPPMTSPLRLPNSSSFIPWGSVHLSTSLTIKTDHGWHHRGSSAMFAPTRSHVSSAVFNNAGAALGRLQEQFHIKLFELKIYI